MALAEEMNESDFNRVLVIVADKVRWALDNSIFPGMNLSPIKHNQALTDDHIIQAQAILINELCLKVDEFKREKKELEAECMRLRKTIGWLRETHRPMEVKINA